jgi:hypothetical protein
MDIIDRMELSMDDLIKIKTLIAGSKWKYSKNTREFESIDLFEKRINDKIKFFWIPVWVKKAVWEVIAPKLWRLASRKARADEMKAKWVNQTKDHRRAENERRFPVDQAVNQAPEVFISKEYVLIELPEEEWKVIYWAHSYLTKLVSKTTITKSELLSLKDFFDRAAKYLDRFESITSYEKINNLKNRLKVKANKCWTRVPPIYIQKEYDDFIDLISK